MNNLQSQTKVLGKVVQLNRSSKEVKSSSLPSTFDNDCSLERVELYSVMFTRVCNKWSSTFIHRLFLLNSILLSLFLCSLLSDANQPGISTCNTHALEHTGVLLFICDLASLDWQAWWLDGYYRTLQLLGIGKFSRLELKQITMAHYFYLLTSESFTALE